MDAAIEESDECDELDYVIEIPELALQTSRIDFKRFPLRIMVRSRIMLCGSIPLCPAAVVLNHRARRCRQNVDAAIFDIEFGPAWPAWPVLAQYWAGALMQTGFGIIEQVENLSFSLSVGIFFSPLLLLSLSCLFIRICTP